MSDLKRMRLLCGLRQIDVWAGTGIPLYRISLAEREGIQLTECEERLLRTFLQERWAAIEGAGQPLRPTRTQGPESLGAVVAGGTL